MKLSLLVIIAIFLGWFGAASTQDVENSFVDIVDIPKSTVPTLDDALSTLTPRSGRSALLLGFDTDVSDDAKGYTQYYDDFEKLTQKDPTNKTLLLVREGENLVISASLDYLASPQANGWMYLGQARYFEPKPRGPNEELDKKEQDGWLKNFGFDYSRIWVTDRTENILAVQKSLVSKTKHEIDKEYKNLSFDEREYHRNITDYEKISWVSDGYYIVDGYWSRISGGAAWFQADEKSRLVNLANQRLSGRLFNWVSKKNVIEKYKEDYDANRRSDPSERYNDHDGIWARREDALKNENPEMMPTFTIQRNNGRSILLGRTLVAGNAHRSFLESVELGDAPQRLVKYDNPNIDFEKIKALYPDLIDVFVSPNQNMVILLTKDEFVLIDAFAKKEKSRIKHSTLFNKVVMVEWSTGDYVDKWRRALLRN